MQRLLAELASLPPSSGHVTWKETRSLPYLDACIKEAGRLHPPFGLPLERVVPAAGATICGQHFRAGTVVGMNAWVIHRDKHLFGEDAAEWRPERWLCGDLEKRKRMEAGLLTVGLFLTSFWFFFLAPFLPNIQNAFLHIFLTFSYGILLRRKNSQIDRLASFPFIHSV